MVGALVALMSVAVWIPAANARSIAGTGVCIERPHAEVQGRVVRDHVTAPKHDELSRWIDRNANRATTAAARATTGTRVRVPVWFHVIRKDTTVVGGNVPRSTAYRAPLRPQDLARRSVASVPPRRRR